MVHYEVENHVVVFATRSEIFLGVIDDVICSDRSNEIYISRAAYAGYFCAERLGDLNRECAYASRRAIDQDFLARLNLCLITKRLQRRESRNRHRRPLLKRNLIRLHREC